jgi:enoyl-CoA hydratase
MFETILTEIVENHIGVIRLNRPKALNALSEQLMNELSEALNAFEKNDAIRVMILTGSEKAFAAGADIKEMASQNFAEAYKNNFVTRNWEDILKCRKPVIGAVAGFALGGGCELAMMCDFLIAADTAKFGQPEVTLGVIPGAGGTQRLPRLIGRGRAMELCLTGRMIDAAEAEKIGMVVRVVPAAQLMDEVIKTAQKIASMPPLAVMMMKDALNMNDRVHLPEGLAYERRLFHAAFSTHDQKEGMDAFINKRAPVYKGE